MAAERDYWTRIKEDDRLTRARQKLSMDELRILFQHARDSVASAPTPDGEVVKLAAETVPYSSVVGGGLTLKAMNGRVAFIVNFMGTTDGITKAETAALSEQFSWFARTYGCAVPKRA